MKVISHHYHPLGHFGAIEHEHLVNPGREHTHEKRPGDDVQMGVSTDELPVPAPLRGEAHPSPMRVYTTPKPD